jgi:hypothetical protein
MKLPVPGSLGAVDYSSRSVPSEYHCGKCGAIGVKLWREYQTFLDHQSSPREEAASHTPSRRTTPAESLSRRVMMLRCNGGSDRGGDQIGWRIPAVPTENGETFWGYSSVPDEGVTWWKRLALRVVR